jgi:hypothetical protein
MNGLEAVPPTEIMVALAAHHFARRLSVLPLEPGPAFPNPAESRHDCQTDCVIVYMPRDGDSNPTVRRVDPDMQVLDVPPYDGYRNAGHLDHMWLNTHVAP